MDASNGQNLHPHPEPKDAWDKVGVIAAAIGGLAIPVVVLVGGYLLDRSLKDRTADIQEILAAQTAAYQYSDLQIRRASLVRELLPVLTAAAPKDRIRGYHIALWALPTDAPTLLSNLYDQEEDDTVRKEVNPLFNQHGIIKAEVVVKTPVAPQFEEKELTTRSLPQESGAGSGSTSYQLCSDPPLPANAVVVKHEFQLIGDRACNAWSTCNFAPQNNQICYAYSLQGHNEFPAVLENQGRRKSQGVLRVVYRVPK